MRTACLWLLVPLALSGLVTAARPEQDTPRCFGDDPAKQVCIEGRFLAFWERHGGASVFGEPIAASATATTPDGTFTVQYFEKARLELHPENPAPYDVLLGRIGVERLEALGRGGEIAGTETAAAGCQFFAATGHNICGRFLLYWRLHGLRIDEDPVFSEQENLALLGLPLTAAATEAGPSGEMVSTQWFERARLVEDASGTVSAVALGREVLGVSPAPAPTSDPGTPPSPTTGAPPPEMPTSVPPTPTSEPAPPPPASPPAAPIINVPIPSVPCDQDVPSPANGLQVWVAKRAGGEPDQMTVCVRLILGGEAIRGANAIVYRHYSTETRPTLAHTTGPDGVAAFIFYVGRGSPGRPGSVEAVVSYRGVTYITATADTGP